MNKQDLNNPSTEVAMDYDMDEEEQRIKDSDNAPLMGTEPIGHKRLNSFVAQDTAQVIQNL